MARKNSKNEQEDRPRKSRKIAKKKENNKGTIARQTTETIKEEHCNDTTRQKDLSKFKKYEENRIQKTTSSKDCHKDKVTRKLFLQCDAPTSKLVMVGGNKCYYKGKITIDFSPKYQSREDNAKAKYNKVLEDIERKERRSKKIGGPDKFLLSVGNNKKELSEEPPLNTFPTFNKDKKYYTPSFVLPCNRLNQGHWIQVHRQKLNELQSTKKILLPKPKSKNLYCGVCKRQYRDYQTHIQQKQHIQNIENSRFNQMILDIEAETKQNCEGIRLKNIICEENTNDESKTQSVSQKEYLCTPTASRKKQNRFQKSFTPRQLPREAKLKQRLPCFIDIDELNSFTD